MFNQRALSTPGPAVQSRLMAAFVIIGLLPLAGCPSAVSNFARPGNQPAGAPPAVPARDRMPYSISAVNRNAFTEFTIRNEGPSELPVRRQELALLLPSSRQQLHYDPKDVIIDMPEDCRVAPGQSVTGRIRYLKHPDTTGCRLVYNPGCDQQGRFAVIAAVERPQAGPTP